MNDEDFVMGYAVGFNDGVSSGGGGSGGIIIKDGATVYDVPILHNYSISGTDYGFATFDVNECAFLNLTPDSADASELDYYTNKITGKVEVYKRSEPNGLVYRSIAYALTKGGKAIGIYKAQSRSFMPYGLYETLVFIEDGTIYPRKEKDVFTTIRNPILTFEDVPLSGSPQTNLKVYLEYDVETREIKYSKPQSHNDGHGYYYLKSELEAQTVESDNTTTVHTKIQIAVFARVLSADKYPEEWLGKYKFQQLQNPIFGISIMDNFELSTSFFDGIA